MICTGDMDPLRATFTIKCPVIDIFGSDHCLDDADLWKRYPSIFPRFSDSGFTPLIRVDGDELPTFMEYTWLEIDLTSETTSSVDSTLKRSDDSSSSLSCAPASSDSAATPQTLKIGIPQNRESIMGLWKSYGATQTMKYWNYRTRLGFLISRLGGHLYMSYPPSEEELRLYMDVIHMNALLGTDCPQTKDTFVSVISSLATLKSKELVLDALNYAWYECNKSSYLLSVLLPACQYPSGDKVLHRKRDQAIKAFSPLTLPSPILREPVPTYPFSHPKLSTLVLEEEGEKASIRFVQLVSAQDASQQTLHLAHLDMVYLHWPYARKLLEGSVTTEAPASGKKSSEIKKIVVPLSDATILHVLREIYAPGCQSYLKGSLYYEEAHEMSYESSLEIIQIGPELGFYSASKQDEHTHSILAGGVPTIFYAMVSHAIKSLSKPCAKNVVLVFNLLHDLMGLDYLKSFAPPSLKDVPLEDTVNLHRELIPHFFRSRDRVRDAGSKSSPQSPNFDFELLPLPEPTQKESFYAYDTEKVKFVSFENRLLDALSTPKKTAKKRYSDSSSSSSS